MGPYVDNKKTAIDGVCYRVFAIVKMMCIACVNLLAGFTTAQFMEH
jgi:hypothetical protein